MTEAHKYKGFQTNQHISNLDIQFLTCINKRAKSALPCEKKSEARILSDLLIHV